MLKVLIGGNIGAGKSTLIEALRCNNVGTWPQPFFAAEPVEEWSKHLSAFYAARKKDPGSVFASTKDAHYKLQKCIDTHYASVPQVAQDWQTAIFVGERSPHESYHVFCSSTETMSAEQHADITNTQQATMKMPFWQLNGSTLYVYLRRSPRSCFDRIKSRGRPCETQGTSRITLQYLETLDRRYECFFESVVKPSGAICVTIGPEENAVSVVEGHVRQWCAFYGQ